ncbi:hypothetical protein HELRODRAFT_113916 [Helobdella robusta]|uniref:Amino acid permease/ SLC12A domain-containing protein n=1 Tax=Helobdella robusta TaxID=6412 RepID=T1EFX4_HELRO|nr:hypothetical protein HELRODRAFT_113916 [Helobdella robusta]ESN98281.1 hypothetical protein HELRODRAFT_113916 [Helobdella robusta]
MAEEKIKLKRKLGLAHGMAIIIGLVVGGGIYITPQGVLMHAGSPGLTLIIWIIGGIHSLFGALCYAELGVNFPSAGAEYAYLSEMYSPYFGFMQLSIYLLLLRPGSNSFKAVLLGRYILKPLYPDCQVPTKAVLCVASFMTMSMCALNYRSVKFSARGQSFMTSITITTLLCIIASGIYFVVKGDVENLSEPFHHSATSVGDIVMSFYSTVFAYSGWNALNVLVEEVKNPKRTLPISIVVSSLTLTILYTLVNYSYLVVLGKEGVLKSDAVAVSVGLRVWTPLAWVMSLCIAVTACASFNSGILVGSRVAFAGARAGHLPEMISYVSLSYFTPVISVIAQGILILVFIWFVTLDSIIKNLTFCYAICELIVILGLVRIRLKERKNLDVYKDKLKMPLFVLLIYAVSLTIITIVPLVANFQASALIFVIVVLVASAFYAAFVLWRPDFVTKNNAIDGMNNFVQKLFFCAPGGKNELTNKILED